MKEYKLCYINGPWAWFTTADLADQWGDDWNDAPYEHNAGDPYFHRGASDDLPEYDLIKVAFDGDFERPCDVAYNSPYSVQGINAGMSPWLVCGRYSASPRCLPSGVSLAVFYDFIESNGGTVFQRRIPDCQ